MVSHLKDQMGFSSELARPITGPSYGYIWTSYNQNSALVAVNEARQVGECYRSEPLLSAPFRFFCDGFSNYRNSNLPQKAPDSRLYQEGANLGGWGSYKI